MDIVKDLSKLIDDCTENEVDFKDLYYELISLRDKCSKQLILPDVVSSKRFEEKDLLIAYQTGYIENGCIDYVLNFDERMDLLKNAEKWTKSYKK